MDSGYTLNFSDRGVNDQNIHIHAKILFKTPLKVAQIDLSNNDYFDDLAFKQLITPLKKADNLEFLSVDKTGISLTSIS